MGRPVQVTVGALASADDDAASTTQKVAGAQYLVINGAKSDGTTANNVCQSQTPGGAGNLTLNGTLASSVPTGTAVAYLGLMRRIYFTCVGNESGRTFTITGLGYDAHGGPFAVKETLTGANASLVASQKLYYSITSIAIDAASANAITVGAAGVATFDLARRVIVTSGGNDTGITFTLAGTDASGALITEVVTGASGAAASSVLDYKTVTSVLSSGAAATTVIVGTNGVASSPWVRFDDYASMSGATIQCVVTGTVNYDVEESMQDPNALGDVAYAAPALMTWTDSTDTAVVGATATKLSSFTFTPLWARVTLNSGTGSVNSTFRQSYLR